MAEDTQAGPVEKALGFARRTRQAPNTIDEVATGVEDTRATLDDLRSALAELEGLVRLTRDDGRAGVAAIGDELQRKHAHFTPILDRLDGSIAGHAAALHRAVAAPARRAAARALWDELGPPPELRRGLSVFTLCWEHGSVLAESVRSALAVLDLLPPEEQGQVLILDDASTDATPRVATELAAADERVRVIRAETNLGLALARTTLLHAAGTTHAFQLDADNTAIPAGVADLYRVAVETGAALTYGNVVQVGPDGVVWGPMSNEPPTPALFTSNYVDTMALSDVAAYRALGGWPTDPLLEHVDDWASVHQVIQAGLLVAFVPTLVGRYQQLATSFHHTVPDGRIGADRVARVYDPTGQRQGDDPLAGVRAVAFHPATGPLWATPDAIAADPTLAPSPPEEPPLPVPERRILVVASGGVANLGDDALTVRGLERAFWAFGPGTAIDLVTDGPTTPAELGGARWLGPLPVALRGLAPDDLGPLDAPLAAAATRAGVGTAAWRPLDPVAYDAAVILGSGLTSLWADKTIEPHALLAAALRRAGVPYACSGQGLGPFAPGPDAELVAGLLAGAVAVSTRDRFSAELAVALPGVDAARVAVTGDDALGLTVTPLPIRPELSRGDLADARQDGLSEEEVIERAFEEALDSREAALVHGGGLRFDPDDPPVLAMTIRNADYVADQHEGLAQLRRWALAIDALAAERGWQVRGVALNTQPPEPEVSTLALLRATTPFRSRWHIVECGSDPRSLVEAILGSRAMVAQSYHAALFALAARIPTVLHAATPYYVGKARGLAQLAGLPDELAVARPDDLASALDAVDAALDRLDDRRLAVRSPLREATLAVDAWWEALPGRLGAASG